MSGRNQHNKAIILQAALKTRKLAAMCLHPSGCTGACEACLKLPEASECSFPACTPGPYLACGHLSLKPWNLASPMLWALWSLSWFRVCSIRVALWFLEWPYCGHWLCLKLSLLWWFLRFLPLDSVDLVPGFPGPENASSMVYTYISSLSIYLSIYLPIYVYLSTYLSCVCLSHWSISISYLIMTLWFINIYIYIYI